MFTMLVDHCNATDVNFLTVIFDLFFLFLYHNRAETNLCPFNMLIDSGSELSQRARILNSETVISHSNHRNGQVVSYLIFITDTTDMSV